MAEFTMQLNSPITDEQWDAITDAELEHSKEIELQHRAERRFCSRKCGMGSGCTRK